MTRAHRAARSRSRDVIARSAATKQSTLLFVVPNYGLLRGACHRARIRATRWLAITVSTRATFPIVVARLDRAIQYSRGACDRIENPRRTGYPAGACHWARRRRDLAAGYDVEAGASQ